MYLAYSASSVLGREKHTLERLKELEEEVDVFLLGVLRRLTLELVPGVPLVATGLVKDTRARNVDIAHSSLLVQAVDLKLLGLVWLHRAILRKVLDHMDSLLELFFNTHDGESTSGRTVPAQHESRWRANWPVLLTNHFRGSCVGR